MAPKKAVAVKDKKELTATCALFSESCALPGWDDQDNVTEAWGGDVFAAGGVSQVDPSTLFVDNEMSSTLEQCFGSADVIAEWKRPSNYFSPFKPVVFRSPLPASVASPYAYTPKDPREDGAEDDDDHLPSTQEEVIKLYRQHRPLSVPDFVLRAHDAALSNGADGATNHLLASPVRRVRRRHDHGNHSNEAAGVFFMRAFHSALALLQEEQARIPAGQYAWEF
ncbi:Hypothetical protein, putative [Bodo saltans]|uniref:Uncharacterized protein n=1 Tax=Bodo saltans TaxID=75058 RepID=A0A0S4KRA9_BODSA|nr:Hypothetical protein, putative [Bodo saltans]|eukprot:CUI15523.1 Hypothetical protein, putative [Bodo saltans]